MVFVPYNVGMIYSTKPIVEFVEYVANQRGLKLSTVSQYIFRDTKRYEKIRDGKTKPRHETLLHIKDWASRNGFIFHPEDCYLSSKEENNG